MRVVIRSIRLAAALAALSTATAAAQAVPPQATQEVRVPAQELLSVERNEPQALPSPSIDLATAVRLTLRQSPDLQFARQDLRSATGRWQQARGAFDNRLSFATTFGYTQQPITPALRGRETDKRRQLLEIANGFTTTNVEIRAYINATAIGPVSCPVSLVGLDDPLSFSAVDRMRDPLETQITGVSQGLRNVIIPELRDVTRGFNFADLCSGDLTSRRGSNRRLWEDASLYGPIGLDRVLNDFPQFPHEIVRLGTELSEAIAARARLGYERLGGVPYGELRENLAIDASLSKPFRNGLILGADAVLQSTAHHFLDKPLDPTFGGFEQPNRFPSRLQLSLTAPLGRGFGRTAVTANERAALHLSASRRDDVLHSASEQVLRTVQAYLDVLAARQRLALFEQSVERQAQLVKITAGLVESGDMVAAENNRALARQASVVTSASRARTDLLTARMRLADALGLSLADADAAPLPEGQLAETLPALPDVSAYLQAPLETRYDRRSLARLREASSVLAAAGRSNLRGRYDFSFNAGYSNTYESPLFFFLRDERAPIISPDPQTFPEPGVRFGTPRGFFRSLTGRWEPFAFASVSIELPFGNNAARGRLMQAEANVQSAEIQAVRLDRVARENIVASDAALRRAGDAVEQLRATVSASQRTLDSTLEALRAGETTLFSTIRTEDELLNDRLQLVGALQQFYQTLARLKFEAGTLVNVEGAGGQAETLVFNPADFVR